MQEGMLHLGQNLAEKLEHLLPHAWWVLRVGDKGLSVRGRGHAPARTAPPLPSPWASHPCGGPLLRSSLPSLKLPIPLPA